MYCKLNTNVVQSRKPGHTYTKIIYYYAQKRKLKAMHYRNGNHNMVYSLQMILIETYK